MKKWEENVRRVVPYTPGEQPDFADMIKLNTNENPYPPAPGVERAMRAMQSEPLRLYPAPGADSLVEGLANYYNLKKDQVFVGVGSDDVLAMAFLTFFNSDRPILFPDITYSFYDVWADLFRIPYECQPLNERFEITKEDYFKENGGIVFPNPNAPTGEELSLSAVEEIIAHNQDVVVIVDEAYVDFGAQTAVGLIEKYDNLLVVQTFSKSRSLAGLRIGYAFGSSRLIKYLNDAKYSFNSYTMNRPSLSMGAAALEDEAYFRETVDKIVATRERTKKELAQMGFLFGDSKANFLFATHPDYPAKKLFEALREKHIFVRYFAKPRIDNYLRITIGTDAQMDALIEFLKEYTGK
ncbi:MAG: histidinol-phosphate transaminase [Eubacteriales bacterium]|nr:histidinol-phosphate transaminase [Eubacteriales bacterium]